MTSGIIRVLLALTVVAHHLSSLGIGKTCVFIFFSLSGYWVGRMWDTQYDGQRNAWTIFVASRFFRIWPLFLVLNLCALASKYIFDSTTFAFHCADPGSCIGNFVSNALILGYAVTNDAPLPPAWSLDIELQFYILAPALIRILKGGNWPPVVLGVLCLSAVAVVIGSETVFTYLPFFLSGLLVASLNLRPSKPLAAASLFAGLASLVVAMATAFGRSILITGSHPQPNAAYNGLANIIIAILFIPSTLYVSSTEQKSRFGARLADFAFVVYLVHWIPVSFVSHKYGSLPPHERLPYVALAICVTLLVSTVICIYFVQPLEKLRKRIVGTRHRKLLAPERAA